MRGEIVYIAIHDLGAEIDLARIRTLYGAPVHPAPLVTRNPRPTYGVTRPPLESAPGVAPTLHRSPASTEVRLHAVGAVSVRIRVPFDVPDLATLHAWRADLHAQEPTLPALAALAIESIRPELAPGLIEPYDIRVDPEPYTVFVLTHGAPDARSMLDHARADIATLLEGEPHGTPLSSDTIDRALRHVVTYRNDDAAILGWDRALLVDPDSDHADHADVLDIIELANLELLELRAYDAYLDDRISRALTTLDTLWGPRGLFHSARAALRDITNDRIEFERLTDNLRDTHKLFGDWHLAKIHAALLDRFHVPAWQQSVDEKMATLKEMFLMAGEETNHRRGLVLETMIVLLFIIDIVYILSAAAH